MAILYVLTVRGVLIRVFRRCATPHPAASPATFSRKGRRDVAFAPDLSPATREMQSGCDSRRQPWPTSLRKIGARLYASSLFHVKQGSASRPMSISSPAGKQDQSHRRIDLRLRLDPAHRRFGAAPRPCARGQPLGRHGFRGRLSRPRDRNPARRRSRRHRPLHRKRPAQVRFPARGGPPHRGRGGDPRQRGSRRSTPPVSELWTPSPRAPSPPCR